MNEVFTWKEIGYVEDLSNKIDTLDDKNDIDKFVGDLIYEVSNIMMHYNSYKINAMSKQKFIDICNKSLIYLHE